MRPRPGVVGAALLWAVSGCAVVGYPSPSPPPPSEAGDPQGTPERSDASGTGSSETREAGGSEAQPPRGDPDFRRDRPPSDPGAVDVAAIPDAVPRQEEKSRYGNMAEYEVFGRTYRTLETSTGYVEEGMASWYGEEFHGRNTSSGEPFDMYAMSAAHARLPLPSYVEVTNLDNGRRVIVRVNDRGPFHDNRLIDLSYAAAWKLDMIGRGTARVRVRALEPAARDE